MAYRAIRTAVVTGASSGIGREFARELAKKNHNLVLIARREDRLMEIAEELSQLYKVQCRVFVADLLDPKSSQKIANFLEKESITPDVLVNSAGFGTANNFVDEDPARIAEEICVNVLSLTMLTRLLLPALRKSDHGVLINISSTASFQPIPGMAVYSASKSFVSRLTEAIWFETRRDNMSVLCVCPGPTETEFFDAAGSNRFRIGRLLTVEEVVSQAFRSLKSTRRFPTIVVGRRNRITVAISSKLPRRLVISGVARVLDFVHGHSVVTK